MAPYFFTTDDKPTRGQIEALIHHPTPILTIVIGMTIGEVACSSEDGTLDGLNEVVDEILSEADGTLSDVSYDAVGIVPRLDDGNLVLIEVTGDASDLFEFKGEIVVRNPETGKFFREPDEFVDDWHQASGYSGDELNAGTEAPDLYPKDQPWEVVSVIDLGVEPSAEEKGCPRCGAPRLSMCVCDKEMLDRNQ